MRMLLDRFRVYNHSQDPKKGRRDIKGAHKCNNYPLVYHFYEKKLKKHTQNRNAYAFI